MFKRPNRILLSGGSASLKPPDRKFHFRTNHSAAATEKPTGRDANYSAEEPPGPLSTNRASSRAQAGIHAF